MRKPQAHRAFRNLLVASAVLAAIFGCQAAFTQTGPEDWPAMAEISQRKLEKDPADQKAWADLVRARLALGDFTRAEKAALAWRAGNVPPESLNLELMGEAHFGQEKYAAAIDDWKEYLKLEPGNADAWARLATAFAALEEWNEARAAISHALDLSPSAERYALRADYEIRLHDWAAAAKDVEKGNQFDASSKEIQKLFPAFEQFSTWSGPVQVLDHAVAKSPNDAQLHVDRAEWLAGLGFIDAAEDDLNEAVNLDPNSLRVSFWSGALAQLKQQPQKAGHVMPLDGRPITPQFEEELKSVDRSRNAEERALFLLRSHQPLLALDEVEGIDGSTAKATALLELNRLTAAGKAAREAVKAHPKDAVAWLDLARVELDNGNITEALQASAKSLKLKRTSEAQDIHEDAAGRLEKE